MSSDNLAKVRSRFIVVLMEAEGVDELYAGLSGTPEIGVSLIEGRRCRTKLALLTEIANQLEFASHFGHNWDALVDCLDEFAWDVEERHLILFRNAEEILGDDSESEMATFLEIASSELGESPDGVATEEASTAPAGPLSFVFQVGSKSAPVVQALEAAGAKYSLEIPG